jgi:ribosomal protein S18 acetylase RimI-like enzyme
MALIIRAMRDGDAAAVAALVRNLAEYIGGGATPKLTADGLLAARDLIDTVVAEDGTGTLGACLSLMTYSTWRGARGLYIVDLFVAPEARGRHIGERLLRAAARRGAKRGAQFVKLEVDETNSGAERFYARLGFAKKSEDRLFVLEQDRLDAFIMTGDGS